MRKTLYVKFIIAYLIFWTFGFVVVSLFVPNMTRERLINEKANSLYSEAVLIADTDAANLYSGDTSLEEAKHILDSVAVFLNSEIMIINPSGRVILDTSSAIDVDNPVIIEGFDSAVVSKSYYTTGNFSIPLRRMC